MFPSQSTELLNTNIFSASENKKVYGSETPPDYDLSKIKSPLVLFVGTLDQFAVEQDCEVLMKQLTTKILLHKTV